MDTVEKSKKGVVTRKVKIHGLAFARNQPPVYITINYQTIDTEQAFSGTLILSKEEIKNMGVTVGDELDFIITLSK